MQGTPDPGQLAAQAANSCGKLIDQLIIQGIGGKAYTASDGEKSLPGAEKVTKGESATKVVAEYDKTQTIAWNDCTLGGNTDDNTAYVKAGLSTGKIQKAAQKLTSKHNYGPIVCVCNSYAAATMRSDIRAASSDFNTVQAYMSGVNTPYAGVDFFVTCEETDSGTSKVGGNGTYNAGGIPVEYAYVFAMNQIMLGCSMPLTLESGQNPERHFFPALMYHGMYDCVRMFEESVVRIEINKNPTENATWAV